MDAPQAMINTLVISSDHCRTETLASIKSMKEVPMRVLSLIAEFKSDTGAHWPACAFCEEKVYVSREKMEQKKGYTTWNVIEGKDTEFVCEKCISRFHELSATRAEYDVCLDCGSGVFDELQFWCDGCDRGSVHEGCMHSSHDEGKTCHQCLVGCPSPLLYKWKTWNQKMESMFETQTCLDWNFHF